MSRARAALFGARAMALSRTAKNSCSWSLIRSHGGLDEHHVEAAVGEDFGEFQRPVEETLAVRDTGGLPEDARVNLPAGQVSGDGVRRDCRLVVSGQRLEERRGPQVARFLLPPPGRVGVALLEQFLLAADLLRRVVGDAIHFVTVAVIAATASPAFQFNRSRAPPRSLAVASRQLACDRSFVAFQRVERLVRDAILQNRPDRTRPPASRRSECGGRGTSAACRRCGFPARGRRGRDPRPAGSCPRRRCNGETTSRMASRTRSGAGSSSPVWTRASSLPKRRAAASRKWPEPQAGSQTRSDRSRLGLLFRLSLEPIGQHGFQGRLDRVRPPAPAAYSMSRWSCARSRDRGGSVGSRVDSWSTAGWNSSRLS